MNWLAYKAEVNELLAVERKRLGVQPFIDRHVKLAVGDIQRLIPYYRGNLTTTFTSSDFYSDGYASRGTLPAGAAVREMYYVKDGSAWTTISVRWPIREYEFSNRGDLKAGIVGIGKCGTGFKFARDRRDGSSAFWVYPRVESGYLVQVVWDAVEGRGSVAYRDTDVVPMDAPTMHLVYLWVKWKLAREVDENIQLSREYEREYRQSIASLYSEVEGRLRLSVTRSQADCGPSCCDCGEISNPDDDMPTTVQGDPCETDSYAEFDSVYDGENAMVESDTQLWRTARCSNLYPGDGTVSFWVRADSDSVLPNGSDVIQSGDGAILVRTYFREAVASPTVTPPSVGTTYTVSSPLAFQTIGDLEDSNVSSYMVWVADNGSGQVAIFLRTNEELTPNGSTVVQNAAGVLYKIQPVA